MPSFQDAIPPGWIESDSFRETLLIHIDFEDGREALRRAGRVLYDVAVEATRGDASSESPTRTELRAALADLRHLQGYLASIGLAAELSGLAPEDDALARFAGQQAAALGSVGDRIAERL
jgi:hypothetical protein